MSEYSDKTFICDDEIEIKRDQSPEPVPSCSYPVRRKYSRTKPIVFRLRSSTSIINAKIHEAKRRATKNKRQSIGQCKTSNTMLNNLNAKVCEAKRRASKKKRECFCHCKKRRLEHKDSLEMKRHRSSKTTQNDKRDKDERKIKSRHSESPK